MKWLIALSIVFIILIFAILRRKAIEKRPTPAPPVWESRERMRFEDFYQQYYGNSVLPEAVVFKLLEFVSLSSGVEYQLIRPEDLLDSFPKGSLRKHVLDFAEIMVRTLRHSGNKPSGMWFDPKIETVDDFIRKLGPLAARVEEHQRQLHHG
ncbi:MAG TPA: hypothetical protein VF135_01065 [Terriglobales bacterium]